MTPANTVRLAMPAESLDIAQVQREWMAAHDRLAPMLTQISAASMAEAWHAAITRPPLATYRVLVAIGEQIEGFAALGPSDDPDAGPTDALIAEFCVPRMGFGHEDRLMQAAIDTLRADGFERATSWVYSDDDATRELFVEAGWQADGAHQELGDETGLTSVKLVRLHTSIA